VLPGLVLRLEVVGSLERPLETVIRVPPFAWRRTG
jgi:hypothetical protein